MKYIALLLALVCPLFAQTDGPATLPQRTLEIRASFTPSSNYPKAVGPTDSLTAALAAAVPGDTIVVDPANVMNLNGKLILPNGTAQQWITIKTASAMIPDEFTRITPAFAQYLPKIILTASNASIQGGQFVRLEGFEITRSPGTGVVYNLFSGLGHDVILDRVYVHGTPTDETNRGVILDNSYDVAVAHSYFAEFHCMALVGACGDSQAISGGGSTQPDGNYLILDNYLSSSGENILIGGTPATQTPTDLTIQYNELDKPASWNPLDPTYAPVNGKDGLPHPWIVKNNFELKNAQRVLFEGNRMQRTWGGFSQVGAMILLTPKNAGSAANPNGCPTCKVTDVTVRYNWGSYFGQALQIGCGNNDFGYPPGGCGQISVHDNLFDHAQYPTCFNCGSFVVLLGGGSSTLPFNNVTVSQNTFQNDGWITHTSAPTNGAASNAASFLNAGSPLTGNSNFHMDNNILDPGYYLAYSTGGGKANNCWSIPQNLLWFFSNCWTGSTFTGNQFTNSVVFKGYLPMPPNNGTNPSAGANMALVNAAIANQH